MFAIASIMKTAAKLVDFFNEAASAYLKDPKKYKQMIAKIMVKLLQLRLVV